MLQRLLQGLGHTYSRSSGRERARSQRTWQGEELQTLPEELGGPVVLAPTEQTLRHVATPLSLVLVGDVHSRDSSPGGEERGRGWTARPDTESAQTSELLGEDRESVGNE